MAPSFGVESPSYVAVRSVMYLAALVVIGSCAFILLITTRVTHLSGSGLQVARVAPATRRLALGATIVLALAMLARLLAQGYMVGEGSSLVIAPVLRATVWGWGWLLGAAATVLIAGSLVAARRGRAGWHVAAAGTLALALSFSLTGHAASVQSAPAVHVLLDALHVMAAAGWLGTLFVVATVGLRAVSRLPPEARGHAAAELINAFSTVALVCVATLAFTGLSAAWSQLPTLSALWQSRYGQTLCVKLLVLGMTGIVGAYNWRVVRPRLTRPGTLPVLRRSATVELAIGMLVVLVTAVLVATSPPDADEAPPTTPSRSIPAGAHAARLTRSSGAARILAAPTGRI